MPRPRAPEQPARRPVQGARDAAYRHLARQATRFPDLLPSEVRVGDLDARDSALAHAIVDGAIMRWLTLGHIIEVLSGRHLGEQEPRMRAVLLGGAAQLLLLERVPPHAVLDESVEWAKTNIRPGAGGMVNAVLRKVARAKGEPREAWDHHLDSIPMPEGPALGLRGVELPEDGVRRLSVACSLPAGLIRGLETRNGDPTAAALHTICRAPTLLYVKHAHAPIDSEQLIPHHSPDHRVYTGTRQGLIGLLEARPDIWVQDPASSATLGRLELGEEPGLIVDLCAGQGTKTRQLRAMFPAARIIAAEIDPPRLATLKALFKGDERVSVMPVGRVGDACEGRADFVLTDVPCSNTGVLARRREARYRPLQDQLARLIPTQRQIVTLGASLLRKGGHLLYSTCSLEGEENESQARWAVDELGLAAQRSHRIEPGGLPGDGAERYSDGAYAALLGA